jgi:heme/copper-type cytochrome/quinol oxidase subunit 3
MPPPSNTINPRRADANRPGRAEEFAAPTPQRSAGLLGMAFFVVAESIFFLGLFLAYFYMRNTSEAWPPPGAGRPTLALAIVNTAVSLISLGVMWYANRAIARDDRRGLQIGVGIAATLGVLFMAVQSIEFAQLGFTAQTSGYGSAFIALLVFHVIRVFIGVALMLLVLVRALIGQFSAKRRLLVQAATMYWAFIVGVWLVVFYVLYIVV